ncbi:MAG: hypothetical protein PUE05_09025, partial [bacterium]|nr:hypothetical protein [bacterium]
ARANGGLLRTPLTSLAARRKSRFAEKKSATPKKNCGNGSLDSITFVDSCGWVHGCDGASDEKRCTLL